LNACEYGKEDAVELPNQHENPS